MQKIIECLLKQYHKEKIKIPENIADNINRLNTIERGMLRNMLFKEAKKMEDSYSIHWLYNCFKLIDKHRFSYNKVFFSPGKEIQNNIISLLKKAKSNIDLCIFTITDDQLSEPLINCLNKNISIRIITDDKKSLSPGSDIFYLHKKGIPIKTDQSRYHMHNKFGVIDNRIAITGSFNWTYTATKHNQENLLVTSNYSIVKQYKAEFERLWGELYFLESV